MIFGGAILTIFGLPLSSVHIWILSRIEIDLGTNVEAWMIGILVLGCLQTFLVFSKYFWILKRLTSSGVLGHVVELHEETTISPHGFWRCGNALEVYLGPLTMIWVL